MLREKAGLALPYAVLGLLALIVMIALWVRGYRRRERQVGAGEGRNRTLPEPEHAAAKSAQSLLRDKSAHMEMATVNAEELRVNDSHLDYNQSRVHIGDANSYGNSTVFPLVITNEDVAPRNSISQIRHAAENTEEQPVEVEERSDEGASGDLSAGLSAGSRSREALPPASEKEEGTSPGGAARVIGGHHAPNVRRRAPERRGGRHHQEVVKARTQKRVYHSRSTSLSEPFVLKCRLEGMRWILGLESLQEGIEFWQGGNRLNPERVVDTFYPIRVLDDVLVRFPSGKEELYSLAPNSLLLFQLHDLTEGTLTLRAPVRGRHYLLIAPAHSLAEMQNSFTSEAVDLEDWIAYVVLWDPELIPSSIWNRLHLLHGSDRVTIQFEGEWIKGVDHRYRALRSPPRIRWDGQTTVTKLVLRLEERRAGRVWTRSFSVEGNEVEIPPAIREEMIDLEVGRFTVRCYDPEDQLLGSDDFRLIVGLHEVRRELLEDNLVRVQFILADEYHVEPDQLEICPEGGSRGSSFIVDPTQRQRDPAQWDLLQWRVIAPTGATLPVGVNLERFFWVVEDDFGQVPPGERWGSRPTGLSRRDFRATSSKMLWLWIPPSVSRERTAVLEIVEKQEKLQNTVLRVGKKPFMKIPLRDLGHLVPERAGEYDLLLRIASVSLHIATIEIRATCRRCGYGAADEKLLWHHIHREHSSEFFSEIDPEEYWLRQGKKLPERVCQCLYCGMGFADDGCDNANTLVGLHQRKECREARRRFRDGPVTESFRVLTRDQPREMIRALIGQKWQCRCGAVVSLEEQKEHLQRHHAPELLEYS